MRALVVGGGIAGPAVAMALRKAGIESEVYEAHDGPAAGGVFLTVGSNGVDALRTLGADQTAVAAGFATPSIVLRSQTGKVLGISRISADGGATSRTVRRADLYSALAGEAERRGLAIRYGKRLVDAAVTAGGVRAVFADGSQAEGDILVGCDGIHSTVRGIIDPHAPAPVYAGLVGLGGFARDVDVDGEAGHYEMTFGKRGFFGYAVAPDREVWWFANVPRRDEPARGEVEAVDGEEWRRRLIELFADDDGPAVRIIEATPELPPASPMHAIARRVPWHNERMVVIGDAAHAPSPSSGQGASLAVEDAVVLARCLRDVPDPGQAFARYTALRTPRVERIVKQAARVNANKAAGPVARVLRDLMLPVVLKAAVTQRQVAETYGHRIDWNAATAM